MKPLVINSIVPVANRQAQYNEPLDRVVQFFEQYLSTDGNMLSFHFKAFSSSNEVTIINILNLNTNTVKRSKKLRFSS